MTLVNMAGVEWKTWANKTWAESCDQVHLFSTNPEIERVIKCVGPILGQYEAAEKVTKYMTDNHMIVERWNWTGTWSSENLTSYAEFWRLKNVEQYPHNLL